MKNYKFHESFIKDLAFIALVTIVSMVSTHYFIKNLYFTPSNSQDYTSHKSYNELKAGE